MAEDLLPCPFCGGEASAEGYQKWSKPVLNMTWDGGDPITEAYFCNCRTCCVSNITSGIGYRTRAEAIANWNRRAAPTAQEAAKVRVKAAIADQISEGIGAVLRKFCDSPDAAAARQYLHKMPERDWNTLIDMLAEESASAALRAIAGDSHD